MAERLTASSLVPLDLFTEDFPLSVDIAYLKPAPGNIFGVIYRPGARLWLHEKLARVVLLAAHFSYRHAGLKTVVYDGLRTTNAQTRMRTSKIVQQNPHWLEGKTRLLSPPGMGGHPRGMAVDMSLLGADGQPIDMGTDFDFLTQDPGPLKNPAHRDYQNLSDSVRKNRAILTGSMQQAAKMLQTDLLPLPQEWWDFRLQSEEYNLYEPLSDADLPPQMRMTEDDVKNNLQDFSNNHFSALKERLTANVKSFIPRA
jgi:zinc D-Ala-D-Ala dipeptidase